MVDLRPAWLVWRAAPSTPIPSGALRWPRPFRQPTPAEAAWAACVVGGLNGGLSTVDALALGEDVRPPSVVGTDFLRAAIARSVALTHDMPLGPSPACWYAPPIVWTQDLSPAIGLGLPDAHRLLQLVSGNRSGVTACVGVGLGRLEMPGNPLRTVEDALAAALTWMRVRTGSLCYDWALRGAGTTDWWPSPLPPVREHRVRLVGDEPTDLLLAPALEDVVLQPEGRTILRARDIDRIAQLPEFAGLTRSEARAHVRSGAADTPDLLEVITEVAKRCCAASWWYPGLAPGPDLERALLAVGIPRALHAMATKGYAGSEEWMGSAREAAGLDRGRA